MSNGQQFLDRLADEYMPETNTEDSQVFDLARFSLRGESEGMKAKMLEDKFILGRMAILGQSTVFYAKPNAGKTLLTIWLVTRAIQSNEMKGDDVFYVNADDNHKGLTYKNELAEKTGFHMLAPGYKEFKPEYLCGMLKKLVKQDTASGKVLILDTVKKFTDLMDKKRSSEFGQYVRQFVLHGGSVVMLAHVNKHRDTDGKVVFTGTSDLVDDADCAYTLDIVTENASGSRTVKFENFKSRGDVASEEVYRYDASDSRSYSDRLNSIQLVPPEEFAQVESQQRITAMLERNQTAIDAIKTCIREGITKKTELVDAAVTRSGLRKKKVQIALEQHAGSAVDQGQLWHVVVGNKNAHVYQLNYGV